MAESDPAEMCALEVLFLRATVTKAGVKVFWGYLQCAQNYDIFKWSFVLQQLTVCQFSQMSG